MSDVFPYTMTGDSIVVIVDGKMVTVQESAANYKNLRKAIEDKNWDEARKHCTVPDSLEAWSKGNFKFVAGGREITYKGEKVPTQLAERMVTMARKGESPEGLMRFWEKLQKNPSWRSVEQLFPFLSHQGIPILPTGNFLAYKGVKDNYTDAHSGTIDNKPGVVNEMPRNKISDDPKTPCHYGYHVGALGYARSFSSITIVCEVDPTDVVCIPYDESQQKMRVCKYKVVGNHNGELLPSTSYELETEVGKGSKIVTGEKEELNIVEDDFGLTEAERKLVLDGSPVMAIKSVRARTKVGLKEAMATVNAFREALIKKLVKPQKELKKERKDDKQMKLVVNKKFKKIHAMKANELMKQPLEALRSYASQVLHMVGASKIPGGKAPLVNQIGKTRKNFA